MTHVPNTSSHPHKARTHQKQKTNHTSIVALNDQLAIGALSVLRASGLRVPDDVQVIGFDNIEESAYLQIPLTTMDSRLDWTAPTAVGCILGRIQGDAAEPKLLTTPSSVIVRSSTR